MPEQRKYKTSIIICGNGYVDFNEKLNEEIKTLNIQGLLADVTNAYCHSDLTNGMSYYSACIRGYEVVRKF